MRRNRIAAFAAVSVLACSTAALRADVRADEKAHVEFAGMLGRVVNIFGGRAAREGVTSTVAVKGDRKATLNDSTGQIIDLSEEKVYDLDVRKKTYRVTTFAELRKQMEDAEQKAEQQAQKEQPKEAAPAPAPKAAPADEKQIEIDFDLKDTGEKKTINGFDTHQVVMTITVREKGKTLEEGGGLVLTSDMWMGPRIAAMKEVADFDRRYSEKLYGPVIAGASPEQTGAAMAMYPTLKPAMGRMSTEGAKLDGTAILTTTTIDAVKSAEQVAAEKQQQQQQESESKPSASGGVGGIMGGFAKKLAQKKVQGDAGPKPRATFMTMNTEVLKVTTEVGATDVAVPAGFQQK
jgi:hypothetical protein